MRVIPRQNRTSVRNGRQSSATLASRRDRLAVARTWLTRQLRVATLPAMFRRLRPPPPDDASDGAPVGGRPTIEDADDDRGPRQVAEPGLGALPIAGITRRRAAAIVSGIVAAWIVIVFVRQVGAASAATGKADEIAIDNGRLHAQVASLERELELIGRQRYHPAAGARLRPRVVARDRLQPRRRRPAPRARRPGLGGRAGRCQKRGRQPARALADRPLRPRGVAAPSRTPATGRRAPSCRCNAASIARHAGAVLQAGRLTLPVPSRGAIRP